MICPKCKSENVNVQMITETHFKNKKRGFLYWLFIGWWLEFLLWFFLTIPRLLIALFMPKRKNIVNTHKSFAVCQNCGHNWEIN